jgi:hypothetical protein
MTNRKYTFFVPLFLILFAGTCFVPTAQAQSVDLGADLVSRYVWRGTDFGNTAAIQPSLSYSSGGFTVGAWGSFDLSPVNGSAVNENDLYASYAFETSAGTFSVNVTDFYFSNPGNEFFDYDNETGSHVIEPGLSYSGPVSLSASINAYGRGDENEIWLEASVPFSVEDVDLSLAMGGTPNDGAGYYGTDADTDAAITKFSLTASKSVEITDSFSLPISASYYLNPYSERSYFIFGISL